MEFVLGTAAFAAFFAYDVNSVRPVRPWFHRLFAVGCALLAAATGLLVWNCRAFFAFSGRALALGALAAVFLALMVYTLFFALPFSATYLEENAPRKAYTGGMYALCRHPGVLWFAGAYLCLGLLLCTLCGSTRLHRRPELRQGRRPARCPRPESCCATLQAPRPHQGP